MKQKANPSASSSFRCLPCPKFRVMCGGMPTRGLTLKEWCERIRDVMDYYGLSAAYVAQEANVSQRTVERIHAVNIDQDIMRSTCRQIELVVFGNVTRLMCDMDYDSEKASERIAELEAKVAELKDDVAYWRKENDRKAKIIDKYLD